MPALCPYILFQRNFSFHSFRVRDRVATKELLKWQIRTAPPFHFGGFGLGFLFWGGQGGSLWVFLGVRAMVGVRQVGDGKK